MKIRTIILWLGLATLAASPILNAQEGDVKYRRSVMAAVGGHAGAIAEIAYGAVPHTDQLAMHAQALHTLSTTIVTAFREQAMTEDPPTGAKPEIWEKWDEFEQKVADLERTSAAVAKAAAEGDEIGVAESLDPMWDSCDGCHKVFRKKQR